MAFKYNPFSGDFDVSTPGPTGPTGPAGSLTALTTLAVASNITILSSDTVGLYLVTTSAAWTITLPLASAYGTGKGFMIKDVSGNASTFNITIARAGADTIDNKTSYVMNINDSAILLMSTGSVWVVL